MNIRSTKIVAALVAMALCTPNIAIARENSNLTTISSSTDIDDDFSITRSISAINRNDSTPPDSKKIYVNPGDTIHVKLEVQRKKSKTHHGFTSFKEEVSPIQSFSASSGSLTAIKDGKDGPDVTKLALDNLNFGTFEKTGERTIELKVNPKKSSTLFEEIGKQVTIDYSYTAGNTLGEYETQFQPHQNFARGSSTFDAKKLNLKVVVEEPKGPSLGKILGWLGGVLGILAVVGGGLWHLLRNLIRI
ncbi:membrane protein [Corynebacterium diphtheriae]|nr:membrane protein [Corynebacterium diphtheriae]CAB0710325.1 membrane protein [Corynebacterium diphtheriae]CAB0816403.1 membrane protein [Corynebacterium diphtheriae]CAB0856981.1 membrane protein [Corynebacterium diphtheriae]CAB0870892.1 membrane protein [Corynebacterium diphtheriae]